MISSTINSSIPRTEESIFLYCFGIKSPDELGSDEKKKKNITSIPDGAIAKIKQLRPVNFNWKDPLNTANQSGFIAQEVKTVIPDLVVGEEYDETKDTMGYAINTSGVVAHLTKALQEAITKIETLETKVKALEEA